MNWYKKAQLAGEWWIIDGQSIFADGDTGDMNHEAYVIQAIQSKYAYDEFSNGEWVDWDGFKKELAREELTEQYDETIAEGLLRDPQKTEDAYLKKLKEMGMTNDEYQAVEGLIDAREYGLKHLGWKRVKSNNVQTETLTHDDLKDIANGLWDAYDEECEKSKFNIEVNSTRTLYEDVPYPFISDGSPSSLQEFRNQY